VDIVVENIYNAITAVLRERGAEIVHERIFGGLRAEDKIMVSRKHALEKQGIISESPVTYIEGNPSDGSGFAGVIIRVVVPQHVGDVWTIFDEGVPCGRGWRRNGIEFIILQNIQGRNQSSVYPHLTSPIKGEEPHERQVQAVIERAERILREQGASYHDVVRTWFYLSDILSWYSEFNEVRNSKYSEFGIMPVPGRGQFILPASTGIGGINPRKSAAVMDLLAITGPPERMPVIKQLTNNRQMDAFHYGSAFSRGVLIRESDVTTIQISGTAAIDDAGKSLYPGDARSQIEYTLDQVETLLGQEGASLNDIAAATVFVKRAGDAPLFREIIATRGFGEMPAICVVADICRAELLFEMDAEVVVKNGKEPK
jgi:enamine deaminase RidA (YjgF/YER057c/UK114 family)